MSRSVASAFRSVRSVGWMVILATALALLSGCGESDATFLLIQKEGEVMNSKEGDSWSFAEDDLFLSPGNRLRTMGGGRAVLEIADGGVVRLNEGTEVEIDRLKDGKAGLIQKSGRTYHHVDREGVYQVNALGHLVKAERAIFDLSANAEAERIHIKTLKGSVKVIIKTGKGIEASTIEAGGEATIDPSAENPILLSDIKRSYLGSDWLQWNQKADQAYGFEPGAIEELQKRTEVPKTVETDADHISPKKTSSSPEAPVPSPTKRAGCAPQLSLKREQRIGGIKLSWSACENENFQFYKVIRSVLSTRPGYPKDPVILSSSNRGYNSFVDKQVAPAQVYHYRVCVVERLGRTTCGNVASFTY